MIKTTNMMMKRQTNNVRAPVATGGNHGKCWVSSTTQEIDKPVVFMGDNDWGWCFRQVTTTRFSTPRRLLQKNYTFNKKII